MQGFLINDRAPGAGQSGGGGGGDMHERLQSITWKTRACLSGNCCRIAAAVVTAEPWIVDTESIDTIYKTKHEERKSTPLHFT